MAIPIAASATTHLSGSDTGSVNLDGSISANDLLLIHIANDHADENVTISGFTEIGNSTYATILAKKAAGTEGSTDTANWDSFEDVSFNYRRIAADDWSQDLTDIEVAFAGGANAPSLTPAGGSAGILWIVGFHMTRGNNGGGVVSSWPTNYTTNQLDIDSGFNGGSGMASACYELTASSEDPGTGTVAFSSQTISSTLCIYPAASGGGSNIPAIRNHLRQMAG